MSTETTGTIEVQPLVDISDQFQAEVGSKSNDEFVTTFSENKSTFEDAVETLNETAKTEEVAEPETSKVNISEHEVSARSLGWVPKDEWKGDPSEWKGAKAFLKDKELFDTISKLNKRLKTQDQVLRQMLELEHKEKEKETINTVAALKTRIKEAAQIGDTDTVEKLSERLVEVSKQPVSELPKLEDEFPKTQDGHTAALEFTKRNPWFDSKDAKYLDAQTYVLDRMKTVLQVHKHLTPTEHFSILEQDVRLKFPDLLNPQPVQIKKAPAVESGANPAQAGKDAGYYWQKIPKEYRDSVRYMQEKMKHFDIKEFYTKHFGDK